MSDKFEIDFLNIESAKSGDAICIRYFVDGRSFIHVVDGGFKETGKKIVNHIKMYYENPEYIDHVVATHNDGDHTAGLVDVLESFKVGALWMNRPWNYTSKLLANFKTYTSEERLESKLRGIYANLAELEKIAIKKSIPIYEAFQGAQIGKFVVLSPTTNRFLNLVWDSEKTPPSTPAYKRTVESAKSTILKFSNALWGVEYFPDKASRPENEMSIVQLGSLNNCQILLTGDTGKDGLNEAADFALGSENKTSAIDFFQVPHHGSRRSVSTKTLDRWLGTKLERQNTNLHKFSAYISASKDDKDHPRKAVIRALIHRGGKVFTTENGDLRFNKFGPDRKNWYNAQPLEYPTDQED